MVPATYKMVDLGGIDLARINGSVYPGIYSKISGAYNTCQVAILCNWKFADITIAPAHVLISINDNQDFVINNLIIVTQDDIVYVTGISPEPVIESLSVIENGVYVPEEGVDGFSPVSVNVPDIPPVVTQLSVTENGIYTPPTGVDGYNEVSVNVPSQLIEADYIGLGYCYLTWAGLFYAGKDEICGINFYHIPAGRYSVFLDEPVSNRFRCAFFANKVYSDFQYYVENQTPDYAEIYQPTQVIHVDPAPLQEDALVNRRFIFTVSSEGELVVYGSSAAYHTVVNSFVVKLPT